MNQITVNSMPSSHGWKWIKEAYSLFRAQTLGWALIFILLIVGMILVFKIPIIGGFLYSLLSPFFTAAIATAAKAQESGKKIGIDQALSVFSGENAQSLFNLGFVQMLTSYVILAASFLAFLFVGGSMAAITTLLGSTDQGASPDTLEQLISLAIPLGVGSLVAITLFFIYLLAFLYAPYIMTFHKGMSLKNAVILSYRGSMKNFGSLTVYGILMPLLGLLAIIPLGLGLLIYIPVTSISLYRSYIEIYEKQPE